MKTATATLKVPKSASTDLRAWRRGVDLALCLFDEADNLDEMALDDDCRSGRRQNNVVLSYLRRLRQINDAGVEAAFAAVLTDFVARRRPKLSDAPWRLRALATTKGGDGVVACITGPARRNRS